MSNFTWKVIVGRDVIRRNDGSSWGRKLKTSPLDEESFAECSMFFGDKGAWQWL